jgi:hypothetical protein
MRESIVHHPFTPEIEWCALHTGQGGQFRYAEFLFLLWRVHGRCRLMKTATWQWLDYKGSWAFYL